MKLVGVRKSVELSLLNLGKECWITFVGLRKRVLE